MTAREQERLTRVEERQKSMQDDLKDVKNDIKDIKALLQADNDKHSDFITKSGLTKMVGLVLSVTVLFFLVFDHVKDWIHN